MLREMSEAASQSPVSYAEYLRLEQREQQKHQWIAGEVFAMAGGSPEHARLQAELIRQIGNALVGGPCKVYSADLRIRSRVTEIATYADVTVVCGPLEPHPEDPDAVSNPTLVIEVLSPTTERFDRGDKAEHYRSMPSVREYVLVAQHTRRIELFRRGQDGAWTFLVARGGEALRLDSVGCTLAVDEIYG